MNTGNHTAQHLRHAGLTLIEILIAILIIAILAAISVPVLQKVTKRAHVATCVANMKSIHAALDTFVADNKRWPQEPADLSGAQVNEFYMNILKNYQLPEKSWFCPSVDLPDEDEEGTPVAKGDRCCYMVSPFGSSPFDPFRYAKQPWVLERLGDHPLGPHIALPDGSILTFTTAYGQ